MNEQHPTPDSEPGLPPELEALIRECARLGPMPEYLKEPADEFARRCRDEAERRRGGNTPAPQPSPPDEFPQPVPPPSGKGSPPRSRRVSWVRLVGALAATVLLAVGLGLGYWLGSRSGAPEVVRPEPAPDASKPLTVTSAFELVRAGPNGPVLEGVVGRTPVAARVGDTLVVRASSPRPAHWVVFARRPDGVVVPLLPARAGAGETEGRAAAVVVRHPVESAGEWLVAAVATESESGYREALSLLATDADLRRPLGSDAALAYAGSVTAPTVMGTTQPPSLKSAIDQFDRLCKRLGERAGGPVRAVALPVAPTP